MRALLVSLHPLPLQLQLPNVNANVFSTLPVTIDATPDKQGFACAIDFVIDETIDPFDVVLGPQWSLSCAQFEDTSLVSTVPVYLSHSFGETCFCSQYTCYVLICKLLFRACPLSEQFGLEHWSVSSLTSV